MHPRVYGCEIRMRLANAIYDIKFVVCFVSLYVVHNICSA